MLDAPVQPGDILADKYQVERVLGVGGMGMVVAATHVQLGHRVALKFMLKSTAGNHDAKDRFLREARAAARLKSEHIAKVSDVGTLQTGAPYIVMEYLEGQDLSTVLKTRGCLPVEEAVLYAIQTCAAMAEAHANSIVHRDLKPDNLYLTRRLDGHPVIKVLDFGVSKLSEFTGGVSTTKTGIAMGTPAYMSPEQMRSAKDVTSKADVWSIGAILFQLLSGKLPFEADTIPEMFAKVLTHPPRDLQALAQHLPPGLGDVVSRCLVKEQETRTGSVIELAMQLSPYGGTHGQAMAVSIQNMFPEQASRITVPVSYSAPTVTGQAATAKTTLGQSMGEAHPHGDMPLPPRGRGRVFAVLGLFALIGLGVGVATQGSEPTDTPLPAAAGASEGEPEEASDPAKEAREAEAKRVQELEESLAKEKKAREEAEARTGEMEGEKLAAEAKREEAEAKRKKAAAKREEAEAKRKEAEAKRKKKRKSKPKPDDSDPFGSID